VSSSLLSGTADWLVYLAVTAIVAVAAAARGLWSPCGLSMISAINPFSERSRGNRYWLTACWFIAGSLIGGALLGGAAAVLAMLWSTLTVPFAVSAAIATGCAVIALISDNPTFGFRLPGHPRQVNERWLGRYRRWVYAAGFGVQIGSGFATYIMTAAVYLTAALAVLSGSWGVALGTGLLFGLVRGTAVLTSAGAADPVALRELHRLLDLLGPWSVRVVVLVEAGVALTLGFLAVGIVGTAVIAVILVAGGYLTWSRRRPAPAGASSQPVVAEGVL